jgi:cytidylate kinase
MIIAIDGTAGVGKGTLARSLGDTLNLALLDTGLLYRAVAYEMKKEGLNLDDPHAAQSAALELSLETLDHPELRSPQISLLASKISAYPGVRDALVELQRHFAYTLQKGYDGAILDGRDIGTVICPDADIKFFLTADVQIRAQRRHKELIQKHQEIPFDELLDQMILRDTQDSTRTTAPLKAADDACVLDTSFMNQAQVLEKALVFIRSR